MLVLVPFRQLVEGSLILLSVIGTDLVVLARLVAPMAFFQLNQPSYLYTGVVASAFRVV